MLPPQPRSHQTVLKKGKGFEPKARGRTQIQEGKFRLYQDIIQSVIDQHYVVWLAKIRIRFALVWFRMLGIVVPSQEAISTKSCTQKGKDFEAKARRRTPIEEGKVRAVPRHQAIGVGGHRSRVRVSCAEETHQEVGQLDEERLGNRISHSLSRMVETTRHMDRGVWCEVKEPTGRADW